MSDIPKMMEGLFPETRDYVDLRLKEGKLKLSKVVCKALSMVLSMLLIVGVFVIVLGLGAYALLHWLNTAVGAPWGTLIVLGFFLIVLVVLWFFRKKLFHNLFVRMFVDDDSIRNSNDLDKAIMLVDTKVENHHRESRESFANFKTAFSAAGTGVKIATILSGLCRRSRRKA